MLPIIHDLTHGIIRHLWIGICLLTSIVSRTMVAQTADGTVYVPIISTDELTDDTPCLIVASDSIEDPTWKGGLYAMTTSSQNGKMLGTKCSSDTNADRVEHADNKMLWRLQRTDNGNYHIRSNATGNYLAASGSDKLKLQSSADDALEWTITIEADGIFRLMAPDGRYLGENLHTATKSYFSRYVGNGTAITRLHIFIAQDKTPPPGSAAMLPQGTQTVLRSKKYVYGPKDETGTICQLPANNYLTGEGMMANDGSLQAWSFDVKDGNTFRLMTSERQGLNYQLISSEEPGVWILREGRITTGEEPCRHLMEYQDRLLLMYDTDPAFSAAKAVSFATMGEEADSLVLPSLTKVLTGAWSTPKLAAVDWTGIMGIDLCKATFPAKLEHFQHRPATGNTLIYISEENVSALPTDCRMVIGCNNANEAVLRRGGRLYDRQPFAIDRVIQVAEGQLEYVRPPIGDEGWQTLCLPFDFTVPEGLAAEICVGKTEDNLAFTPISAVNGGTAVIFCGEKGSTDMDSIRFHSLDCRMHPLAVSPESPLCGTFQWRQVAANDDEPTYMLNATGDTFVRAATGSRIAPFRAYIKAGDTPALRICHTTTGIQQAGNGQQRRNTSRGFTLDGRRLPHKTTRTLLPGICIVGGRKMICH